MNPDLLRLAATAVFAAALPTAHAADYLLAPLIGDRLTVSFAVMGTGSNLSRNPQEVIKLPQLPWDDAIQGAIVDGVSADDAKATFKVAAFREGLAGIEQIDQAEPKDIVAAVLKVLAPRIDASKKQWLIVLWPRKTEHNFQLTTGYIGRGRASGIGFYVDRMTNLQRTDSLEGDVGFLGMFAYFEIALVDPATQKIVATRRQNGTRLYPMAGMKKGHPWEILTSQQKIDATKRVVVEEIDEAMPELMKAAGAS